MKLRWIVLLMVASAVATAPAALARDGSAEGSGAHAKMASKGNTGRQLKQIREKGELISAKDRMVAEDKLEVATEPVELEARNNEAELAQRLAAQFGVTVEALRAERRRLGATWSELLIAHTLQVSSKGAPSAIQLYKIHDDGWGWSQIAYGLGLDMKEFVSAVEAGCRMAAGQGPGDEKPASGQGNG